MKRISNRWVILAVLFIGRVGLGFQFQTLGSVSEHLVDIFFFSYAEIGMLIGAFLLPGVVLALPSGVAGRYVRDRLIVTTGLMFLALGGIVAVIATNFNIFGLARIICGIGFVLTTIFITKMVADWFDGKELATAMSVIVMSWPFGIAIGQVGHVWLAALFDWRVAFLAASLYCCLGAVGIFSVYRAPINKNQAPPRAQLGLPPNQLTLTLLSSLVWAFFNAGYIVYLSFGVSVLVNGGYEPARAAATISLASWVMLFSGAICGQISDRFKRPDLILYVCLTGGIVALVLLPWTEFAVGLSLLFGLIGMAPAGIIMALTAESMTPHRRAFGIGVFFSSYFVITTPAPGIAGWLYDETGIAYWPIMFAAALFLLVGIANAVFRHSQARLPQIAN